MRNCTFCFGLAVVATLVLVEVMADPARADGTIVAWGFDYYRQCEVPTPNSDFIGISAANNFSVGLKQDGSARFWGQCEHSDCTILSPYNFVALSGGGAHVLGLNSDGSVAAWGDDLDHQCDVPPPNEHFAAISAGARFSVGLRDDGTIVVWGDSTSGLRRIPTPNLGFVAVSAGYNHILGLKLDGTVVAWGADDYGQCDVPSPDSGFLGIAAGARFSLGLKADGSIVAWGRNDVGQCIVPAPNADFVEVSAGGGFGLGLKSDRTVIAWGLDYYGECEVPAPDSGFVAVSAGSSHSLALRSSLLGACCRSYGGCEITIQAWCQPPNVWQGPGTFCVPRPCSTSGTTEGPDDPSPGFTVVPNPTRGSVRIVLAPNRHEAETVEVFDAAGRLVRRLTPSLLAGKTSRTVRWDGLDESGRPVSSGVFFIHIGATAEHRTSTVVRIR